MPENFRYKYDYRWIGYCDYIIVYQNLSKNLRCRAEDTNAKLQKLPRDARIDPPIGSHRSAGLSGVENKKNVVL